MYVQTTNIEMFSAFSVTWFQITYFILIGELLSKVSFFTRTQTDPTLNNHFVSSLHDFMHFFMQMSKIFSQGYSHGGCAVNKCYPHDGHADYQYYPHNAAVIHTNNETPVQSFEYLASQKTT